MITRRSPRSRRRSLETTRTRGRRAGRLELQRQRRAIIEREEWHTGDRERLWAI